MIPRRATVAYLLILSSLTLNPVSVYLTTPTAHALIPFTSYQDVQAFIRTSGCSSPTPVLYNRGALTPGPTTSVFGANSNSASSQSPTHSETNQQVSGVDELDNVKNDGQYIYTITNNTVAIVQIYPATDARLLSRVSVSGTLQGIFVDRKSTSELQSHVNLVCRLLLEKKKKKRKEVVCSVLLL